MPKNKQTIYVVMRHDFSGNEVACASTEFYEDAEELVARYTQEFLDKGFSNEEFHFYSTAVPFYKNV